MLFERNKRNSDGKIEFKKHCHYYPSCTVQCDNHSGRPRFIMIGIYGLEFHKHFMLKTMYKKSFWG